MKPLGCIAEDDGGADILDRDLSCVDALVAVARVGIAERLAAATDFH